MAITTDAEGRTAPALAPASRAAPRPWWRTLGFWAVALLASQYVLAQLLTGYQDLDGPRNLQWSLFLFEQPGFLFNVENSYDRVNGFPPPQPELAPMGLANGRSGPLHSWWGPTYLGILGLVGVLTGSYMAMQLVVPLVAGAAVLLTYGFGARFFSRRVGVLAALLLATFPNYVETSVVALVEPLSALLLLGALWAVLERRAWLAALLGTLVVLGKLDMIVLYFGTVMLTAALNWRSIGRLWGWHMLAIALGIPMAAVVPWLVLRYVVFATSLTVSGRPELGTIALVLPLILEQIAPLQRALVYALLAMLAGLAGFGAWRGAAAAHVRQLLGIWAALGVFVLLVYSSTFAASNNPRVFIPALPALFLLVAAGLERAGGRIRIYGLALALAVALISYPLNLREMLYYTQAQRALDPVWAELRGAPRGVVLTERYWEATLYARQPATWFEHDPAFQRAVLHDQATFRSYLASAPIRYIVLPRAESERALWRSSWLAQLYERYPVGRKLALSEQPLVAPEVREYLSTAFPHREVGLYVIYTVQ